MLAVAVLRGRVVKCEPPKTCAYVNTLLISCLEASLQKTGV